MIWFFILTLPTLTTSKIYDRCELARELKYVHEAPSHQLATWVCIAAHESLYNTSVVGHLCDDGSGDHGLFQISDKYWCSPPEKGNGCGLNCADLEDDNIADDFICAQKIYKEHKSLSGDGFNAWAVYQPLCKGGKAQGYIKDCFYDSENPDTNEVDLRTPPPLNFAHRFFGTAAGRVSHYPTTTERTTFDSFFTSRPTVTTYIRPTARTSSYFHPTTTRTTVVVATTSRPTFPNPTSNRLPGFTRTTVFPTRRSFFSIPIRTFISRSATSRSFIPSTRSFFTPSTTTTTFIPSSPINNVVNEPIFIINGVKWY